MGETKKESTLERTSESQGNVVQQQGRGRGEDSQKEIQGRTYHRHHHLVVAVVVVVKRAIFGYQDHP